jgi:hypothetical protein
MPLQLSLAASAYVNGDHRIPSLALFFLQQFVVKRETKEDNHGREAVDDNQDDRHKSPPEPVSYGR